MGWSVRKTLKLGPVNINLSKRGVGTSVGAGGLRFGVDASGSPFVTFGIGPLRGRWGRKEIEEIVEELSSPAGQKKEGNGDPS